MPNAQAYINYGRWLVNCNKCGSPLPADLGPGYTVCPVCWPDMLAWGFALGKDGIYRRIADPVARAAALQNAEAAGEVYRPVYPADRDTIWKILHVRERPNMNWKPGETIEFLIRENEMNNLPSGLDT